MSPRDPSQTDNGRGSAVILMYHRLRTDDIHPSEGDYAISADLFGAHLQAILRTGHKVVGLEELARGLPAGPSVILTFDDGCDTDVTVALPRLQELSLPGAFFVNPALVGRPGVLDWKGVRRLADAGMTVGSHGLDHTLLDELASQELERQLVESRHILQDQLGRSVDALSLPGGTGGRRALRVARDAGYRLVFGSRPGRVREPRDDRPLSRFAIRRGHGPGRIQALARQRGWVLASTTLRYGGMQAVRTLLGTSTKEALRAHLLSGSDTPPPSGGEPR